jgi:sugar phosphate isomerase/epimerase
MWKTSVVIAPGTAVQAPAPLKGSLADTIARASRIGFDAVQFTVHRPAEFDLEGARAALAAHRVQASGIATGAAYAVDRISLGHGEEGRRRAAVARMKEHIDLARELGGADVVIGLIRGTYADCRSREQFMGQYRASLGECLAHAERRRIRIVHEAIGRHDSDVLRTIAENIPFISGFGSPWFRLQIDTYHMALEETDGNAAVRSAKGLLAQVDISDAGRTAPDGRRFDFPGLMKALAHIGYEDHLVFEFRTSGDGVAEAKAGLDYIRSLA